MDSIYKYQYIYHYNTYTETWYCISRHDYVNYFNGFTTVEKIGVGKTVEEATLDKNRC